MISEEKDNFQIVTGKRKIRKRNQHNLSEFYQKISEVNFTTQEKDDITK